MMHATDEIFGQWHPFGGFQPTRIPAPLRCPPQPLRLHVSANEAMSGNMVLENLLSDAGRTRKLEKTHSGWVKQRFESSGNWFLGAFFAGQEGFQSGMQMAALQEIHADELHSHAAAEVHAAHNGARAHFAIRRVEE